MAELSLFERVVQETCNGDDAFLTAKVLLRTLIKDTMDGKRGNFKKGVEEWLLSAAKKRKRYQNLTHTLSPVWKEIDPHNMRSTAGLNDILPNVYEIDADIPAYMRPFIKPYSTRVNWKASSEDKLEIYFKFEWDDGCVEEMTKRMNTVDNKVKQEVKQEQE